MTREDALKILNTPDKEMDQLIAKAEKLRRKYKGDNFNKCQKWQLFTRLCLLCPILSF